MTATQRLQWVALAFVPSALLVALLQVSYVEEIRAVRPLRYRDTVLGRPGPTERRFRLLKAPLQVAFGCMTAWLSDVVLAPSRVTAAELIRDYKVGAVGVVPNVTGGLSWDAVDEESGSLAELEDFIAIPIKFQVEAMFTQEQYDVVIM